MATVRIIDLPAFAVIGMKTWIGGPDNAAFGRFWDQCTEDGSIQLLRQIKEQAGLPAGPRTGAALLGISRVEQDPSSRSFYYMIAIEAPEREMPGLETGPLERCAIPAARWAVFACRGPVPGSIVASEMYAFLEWLPASGYRHAHAPEMEVYPAISGAASNGEDYCEFWLPVEPIDPE